MAEMVRTVRAVTAIIGSKSMTFLAGLVCGIMLTNAALIVWFALMGDRYE